MDVGDLETNTLLIKNISSIVYRIYEPYPEYSNLFPTAALEIERALRDSGHLVSYDTGRRCLWYFHFQYKDDSEISNDEGLGEYVNVDGWELVSAEEGQFEPSSLHKARTQPQSLAQTPTSASVAGALTDQSQRNVMPSPSQSTQNSSQEQDTKSAVSGPGGSQTPSISSKVIYENFIMSILVMILVAFCPATGAIPLNYRTVLLPLKRNGSKESTVAQAGSLGTFGAYLTTTGVLALNLNVSRCRALVSLDDILTANLTFPDQHILAAPFGVHAMSRSGTADIGTFSLAQTPNTQAFSFRGVSEANSKQWKEACLRILRYRGIITTSMTDSPWINVSVARRRFQERYQDTKSCKELTTNIPWPRTLCFRRKNLDASTTSRIGETLLNGHEESHDPLGRAGQWFGSASERDDQILKRKAERSAINASDAHSGLGTRSDITSDQGPIALGRPTMAAAGAMYPTPPDGIPNPNDISTAFEGVSSNTLNATGTELDQPVPMDTSVDHAFDEEWDPGDAARRDRSDSHLLRDAETMGMENGMFGDGDITDADFSFFDQHPDDDDLAMNHDNNSLLDLVPPQHHQIQQTQLQQQEHKSERVLEREPDRPADEIDSTPSKAPAVDPPSDAHVFAKPELKHARSLLLAEPIKEEPSEKTGQPIKRESSPFNPDIVFRRVQAAIPSKRDRSLSQEKDSKRRASVFAKVELGPALSLLDKKYEKGGLFDFEESVGQQQAEEDSLQEASYLRRLGKRPTKPRDTGVQGNTLMRRFTAFDAPTAQTSPIHGVVQGSDDGSSVDSDGDGSSYLSDDLTSPAKLSTRRGPLDEDAISHVTSLRDIEGTDEPDHQLAVELPRLSKPDPPEVSLFRFFADPEPVQNELFMSDKDLVQIAQLVTEQTATGCVDIFGLCREDYSISCDIYRQQQAADVHRSLSMLQKVVSDALGGFTPTKMKGLLEVADIPIQGQLNRLQPRPIPGRDPNSEQLRPNVYYPLPVHHLEVRRSESKLSVLPSAVGFWESLGLGPAAGSKNIKAVCVFPGWNGMADNVDTFLGRIKSVYELLRLGNFDRLPLGADSQDGILAYEVDRISTSPDDSVTGHGSALIETMETVQDVVMALNEAEQNVVIFMVYSPSNPSTIVEACLAFQRFFDNYREALTKAGGTPQHELVLQLVSAEAVSSPNSLVTATASELSNFCMQVYDRCILFNGPMPACAVELEQTPPRMIDFKLTGNPSASLIHENSCIHVAYAQSIDERWVTAAWTDERGHEQATASYCLGRRGRPLSTNMDDIAHEIWETTLEIIAVRRVSWRVVVVKSGPMGAHEMEFWAQLARTESKLNVGLLLMTVDTNPALQLLPPAVHLPPTSMGLFTTPASTPQANIVSPEQTAAPTPTPAVPVGLASTPSADATGEAASSDAALLDLTDQTWGAVLGHRLNNSTSSLELQPTLISGYLIKRTGAKSEDPPVVMEVNLLQTENLNRAYEPLLREMLSHYRGLGTLARARGMVDRATDVRPWHIAAAEKAVRALHMLM